jgi:DNA-binding GntR family transcriptional regulator
MHDFTVPGRIETSIAEHIEIAERVVERRFRDAHRLLYEHIGASLEIVVERATRSLAAMNARQDATPVYLGSS